MKSETELKRLTTSFVVMPMFIRNDVKAKRPMWETLRPDAIVSYSSFMHGGNFFMITSLGSSSSWISPRFSMNSCFSRFMRFITASGSDPTFMSSFPSMCFRTSSSKRRATSLFIR